MWEELPPEALHLTSALRWIGLLGFAWLVGVFDMLWLPLSFYVLMRFIAICFHTVCVCMCVCVCVCVFLFFVFAP